MRQENPLYRLDYYNPKKQYRSFSEVSRNNQSPYLHTPGITKGRCPIVTSFGLNTVRTTK